MFSVTDEWRNQYPGACEGILEIHDVDNPRNHAGLEKRKIELETELRERFSAFDRQALEAYPPFPAYEAYYRRFKKTYHVFLQLESVIKGKAIPSVSALVEAMFMAELKNRLLTAGHDLEAIQPPVRLSVASGEERYTVLRGQEQALKQGDMFIADGQGIISSIIYGPDQRTQITPSTRKVLFTVYAPPGVEIQAVQAHLEELRDYVLLISPSARVSQLGIFSTG